MTRLFSCLQLDLGTWPARHPAEAVMLARAAHQQPSAGAASTDWPLGWEPHRRGQGSTGPRRATTPPASTRGG